MSTEPQESIAEDNSSTGSRPVNTSVPLASSLDAALKRGNGPRPRTAPPTLRDKELMQTVTPALRSENITGMQMDDEAKAYVGPAATTMDVLYQGVQQIIDARNAAAKNGAWSEGQQIIQVSDFAEKVQTRATKLVDKVLADLNRAIAGTEEMLSTPITTGAQTPIASDICQYCRSLDSAERMKFLTAAVQERDVVTLGAVLGRPAYLSGVTKEMQVTLTQQYHRAKTPEIARRLEAMKAAHEKLSNAGSLFIATVEQAQGVRHGVAQRLKAEHATALRAVTLKDA